ncbi:MAG: HipA family kinase [Anaerolineae bacterium]
MFIVKLYADAAAGLTRSALANELLGGLLARALGLTTPDVAVIRIDPRLGQACPTESVSERIKKSPGENFGSQQIIPAMTFQSLRPTDKMMAAEIFAFDMLIQNPDRRPRKPNLFEGPKGLTIIDHEMAFPFSNPELVIGKLPEAWEIHAGNQLVTGHLFYPDLRGKVPPGAFDNFTNRVGNISDEHIRLLAESVPESWRTNGIQHICSYLSRARDRHADLRQSLYGALA